MENNENPFELSSLSTVLFIQTMNFPNKTFSFSLSLTQLSYVLSDPLFSSIVAFYTLILLYLPHLFLKFLFSPVLLLTGIILLSLLRLGSAQESIENKACNDEKVALVKENFVSSKTRQSVAHACKGNTDPETLTKQYLVSVEDHAFACKSDAEPEIEEGFDVSLNFEETFVEWDVKAPLEVIYEEREGEDEDDDKNPIPARNQSIERYPSLSLYYPESDSDSCSSDGDLPASGKWEFPESPYFRWVEEDRDGLIEIALDHKKHSEFQFEEDNLIEIDISPKSNKDWECYKEFAGLS